MTEPGAKLAIERYLEKHGVTAADMPPASAKLK